MSTLINRSASITGHQAANSATWSFQDLDKDNSLDDDGDIVIIGEKRDGQFQEISGPHKKTKLETDNRARETPREMRNNPASGMQSHPTSVTRVNRQPGQSRGGNPVSNVPIPGGRFRMSPTPSRGTSAVSFIIEDDSDEDARPPPPTSKLGHQQDKASEPTDRAGFDAAEKEAARLESSRLRREAVARKSNMRPSGGSPATNSPISRINKVETDTLLLGSLMSSDVSVENGLSMQNSSGMLGRRSDVAGGFHVEYAKPAHLTGKHASEKPGHSGKGRQLSTGSSLKAIDYIRKTETSDAKPDMPPPNRRDGKIFDTPSFSKELNATEIDRQETEAAWIAAEAAKRAESNGKRREQSHKNMKAPREKIPQDAAAKARREADAKKDAEWRRRENQRRTDELRKFEEGKMAEVAQRDARWQQHKAQKLDQDAANLRSSALERLQQANNLAKAVHSPLRQDSQNATKTPNNVQEANAPVGKSLAATTTERRIEKPAQGRESVAKPIADSNNDRVRPPGNSPEEIARQERINAKEARNAKMRQAEIEQGAEVEVLDDPATANLQMGPRPLNRVVRQGMVIGENRRESSGAKKDPAYLRHIRQQWETLAYMSKYRRQLGEIRPQDIKLLEWKDDERIIWADIATLYERSFGQRRVLSTLNKRYWQVKEALDEIGVDKRLQSLVAIGDTKAREELNTAVHGVWPLPGKHRDARGHFIAAPKPTVMARNADNQDQHSSSSATLSSESRTPTEPAVPRPDSTDPAPDAERPHYGGKTWNAEAMQHYIDGYWEELIKMQEEESRLDREQSPMTDEDYCHFAYQVQRRHVSEDEMDDGIAIDDVVWSVCGDDYDNLTKSYVRADQEIMRLRLDFEANGDDEWSMKPSKTGDGLRLFTLEGQIAGTAQVRVIRFMRTYQDGKLPESKDDWAPRTVYLVVKRTVTRVEDELFDEGKEDNVEELLDEGVYTTLEMANVRAVKVFVELTFSPKSRNLNMRDIEIQTEETKWLEQLDEAEMFCKSTNNEDGTTTTVRVKENRLNGPRNILR